MGLSRQRALIGLAAFCGLALAPTPGRCGDGPIAARSSGDGVLTLQAEPTFVGSNNYNIYSAPISVLIKNRGADKTATVIANGGWGRRTDRRIALPGGGAVTHTTVYPAFHGGESSIEIELATGGAVQTRVSTGISSYENVNPPASGQDEGRLALISDRIGSLVPTNVEGHQDSHPPHFNYSYVKPENAPDRVVGYRSVDVLAVGVGAERLSPAQWQTIREWVVSGGKLLILGQKGWTQAGPGFAELSPEVVNDAGKIRVDEDTYMVLPESNDYFSTVYNLRATATTIIGPLVSDAVGLSLSSKEQPALFARRQLGAGCVLYSGFDFTDHVLRSESVADVWQLLAHRAATTQFSVADPNDSESTQAWGVANAATDPFHLALPPLTQVVYVFSAYFMLAVPLTFVVLKRTRRMNLAWVSGPVLAVVFAGVLYVFSARLYLAPLSRRTTGIVFAAAGDRNAQFKGYTEMFFPHGGSYDVTIPHSDSMEYFDANSQWSYANRGAALETIDDGETVHTPELGVTNLSFRRLYHSESVDFGSGITANLHLGGTRDHHLLCGTITNGTGLTLHNVQIATPGSNGIAIKMATPIAVVPPGTTTIEPTVVTSFDVTNPRTAATLTADTDGDAFGPRLGTDASGKGTVTVVVSLPVATDRTTQEAEF